MTFSTITADPPWPVRATGWTPSRRRRGERWQETTTEPPYERMTVGTIAALPVGELAADDAHLYLWTTSRFLPAAFDVAMAWGFEYAQTLVWCKPAKGVNQGAFVGSTEFILYCRRGHLEPLSRHMGTWFTWPRSAHSRKPDAFQDLVETVSPGPYLELFARRQRIGWSTWGNEALPHVKLRT